MGCSEMNAATATRAECLTAPQYCLCVSFFECLEIGIFRDGCGDSHSCITFNNTILLPLCFVFGASRKWIVQRWVRRHSFV